MKWFAMLKCMLKMYRYALMIIVLLYIPYGWWASISNVHYRFLLGMSTLISWQILANPNASVANPRLGNPNEFWYNLPFSRTEIALAHFFVQQIMFWILFGSGVVVIVLMGITAEWPNLLIAFFNTSACAFALSSIFHRFCKPREMSYSLRYFVPMFLWLILGGAVLFVIASVSSSVGLWPLGVAVVIGVPPFIALKRSFEDVEPLTGKRVLRRPVGYRESSDSKMRPKPVYDQTENMATALATSIDLVDVGLVRRWLYRYFSPVSRYLFITVWLRWYWIAVFVIATLLLCGSMFPAYTIHNDSGVAIFLGVVCGFFVAAGNRTIVAALNPLPIKSHLLFAWLFGPWLVMMVLVVASVYLICSNRTINGGYYRGDTIVFCGFSHEDKYDDILAGKHYYGKGLPIPFGKREEKDAPVYLAEEPFSRPGENLPRKFETEPDAKTLKIAQYFSDSLWAYYGVIAHPEELLVYDKDSKTWSVSSHPFFEQCYAAKLHVGLLWSLMTIFPGFLFGTTGYQRKWYSKAGSRSRRRNSSKTAGSTSLPLFERILQWRDTLWFWVFWIVWFGMCASVAFGDHITKHLYPRLFFATHFVECMVVLVLSIPVLYWLSLRALRRIS